jgi:hypothetical protein
MWHDVHGIVNVARTVNKGQGFGTCWYCSLDKYG